MSESDRIGRLERELDHANMLLEQVCESLESVDPDHPYSSLHWSRELEEWWEGHKRRRGLYNEYPNGSCCEGAQLINPCPACGRWPDI